MEKKGRFSPSMAWRWDEAPPRATQGGRGPPGPRSCIRSGWAGPTSGRGPADAFAGEKAPGAAGQRPRCSGQRRPSCRAPGDATARSREHSFQLPPCPRCHPQSQFLFY